MGESSVLFKGGQAQILPDSSDDEDTTLDFVAYRENDKDVGHCSLMLFTWATLGLIFSLPGPTLLAISCSLCTELEQSALLFVSRGIGTLIGAVVGRSLIYRAKRYGVLLLSLLSLIVAISVFPVAKNISSAAGIMFVVGLAYGVSKEGYTIMETSTNSGSRAKGDLNKRMIAFVLGVAAAPLIAMPFVQNIVPLNRYNGTANATAWSTGCRKLNSDWTCFSNEDNNFGKSMWLITIPLYILVASLITMLVRKSAFLNITSQSNNNNNIVRPVDFKVYALGFVTFGVMFFYQGCFMITSLLLFPYVMLGQFELDKNKASILVSLLWVTFSFGSLMLQLLLKRARKLELRLGIGVCKSGICFVSAILLMKIENGNAQTLLLFIYMFFLADINITITQDVVANRQEVFSKQSLNTMHIVATSLAEILLPYFSLSLMYHKGGHSMTFAIMFASLMLLLSCALLSFCPARLQRSGVVSMSYENLNNGRIAEEEDGNNRRNIHKQIKSLLGGHTDQESTVEASEDEVLFDKRRHKQY
eukprot:gene17021-18735_t